MRAASWLTVDAAVATNHARFVNAPGADRIPNALEDAASLGVTVTAAPWTAALRIRRIGPRPLIEDDSVRGEATMVINARVGRSLGSVEASLDLLNVLDSRREDADYFYASRLHGEPLNGVEGVHARAVEPRRARIALRLQLGLEKADLRQVVSSKTLRVREKPEHRKRTRRSP
jgi:hypothetical protein